MSVIERGEEVTRASKLAKSAERAADVHGVRLVFAESGVNGERWALWRGDAKGINILD
jgi:hypothetical protein